MNLQIWHEQEKVRELSPKGVQQVCVGFIGRPNTVAETECGKYE